MLRLDISTKRPGYKPILAIVMSGADWKLVICKKF